SIPFGDSLGLVCVEAHIASYLRQQKALHDEGRALLSPTCSGLPRLLLRVIGLCLGEIARRVRHELGQGRLVAEAIGLASNLRIDGAVRLYVLAVCEAHRAHVVVLAGDGESCSGLPMKKAPASYRAEGAARIQ